MSVKDNLERLRAEIPQHVKLICVSKFHEPDTVMEAYDAGERHFGESRVQELVDKQPHLPEDVQWHFIGHLQRNKIKYMIDFVDMIHGVDSLRLLNAIERQATNAERDVACLLQVHIADEESKFGFSPEELKALLASPEFKALERVKIAGLMGMATFTDDREQVRDEFQSLKKLFEEVKAEFFADSEEFKELSMGMSGDYDIAIEEGSTMVRIGTAIFGERG